MVDQRFYRISAPHSLEAIAAQTECQLQSANKNTMILGIAPIESAGKGDLTFLSNKKYAHLLKTTLASACIISKDYEGDTPGMALLKSDNPYYSYAIATNMFYSCLVASNQTEAIHPSASIGKNCYLAPNVVIEAGVEIGDNSFIGAGTFIGQGVKIGRNSRIDANVTISYSIIGEEAVILSGARLGQDGFGFATHKGKHYKIFHIGRVIVGNDVEIGANTCIDRGSMQDTVIEDGCRIDNLVQVGHNVKVGKGTILVAQVGIAGSSKIGSYCALGGQVGVAGHLTIADKVQVSGQGGVIQNIDEVGVVLGGTPTVPIRDWHRQSIALRNLIKSNHGKN